MKILYLDTSSSFLYTAILDDSIVIDEIKEKLEKNLSTFTLSYINNMLNIHGLKLDDVEKIIVVNGPGSFTGIRIGLTIAKTIAWARKIHIIPISSLEAITLSTYNTLADYIVPIIDARRNFVYSAIYDAKNKNFILKEQYINLDTLNAALENLAGKILFVTNDDVNTKYEKIKYIPDIRTIVDEVKNKPPVNPHLVDANYLKLTEAEENYDHWNNQTWHWTNQGVGK